MYSRSTTVSFTFPTHSEHRAMARSTEPEVFTFDQEPHHQHHHHLHHLLQHRQQQQRRRVTRVMYPAKVRKYLPPAEKSRAKRWLLALCLVLLVQIYTERDDELDAPEAALSPPVTAALPADPPLILNLRSAEETGCLRAALPWMNTTCSLEEREAQEPRQQQQQQQQRLHQRNNPYVVAFLYPAVYHTLGSEQ